MDKNHYSFDIPEGYSESALRALQVELERMSRDGGEDVEVHVYSSKPLQSMGEGLQAVLEIVNASSPLLIALAGALGQWMLKHPTGKITVVTGSGSNRTVMSGEGLTSNQVVTLATDVLTMKKGQESDARPGRRGKRSQSK